jgi:carbon-monoxide dehydrogenase medium subunit
MACSATGLEDALSKSFTPEAAAAVKIDAGELSSDLHASAAYRANLISVHDPARGGQG